MELVDLQEASKDSLKEVERPESFASWAKYQQKQGHSVWKPWEKPLQVLV